MKILPAILLTTLIILAGCTPTKTIELDTNQDEQDDIQIITDGKDAEVTIDFEEVLDEETKEAINNAPEEYCIPGKTFNYEAEKGNTDSIIIGPTTYEGKNMCEAESETIINSPVGDITTKTTYYFDNTYKEYYITTLTSGVGPEQTNNIHIIDGKIQ